MLKQCAAIALLIAATGCAAQPEDIARAPQLNPVGSGLQPVRTVLRSEPAPVGGDRYGNSLWQDASADLFRDPRALRVGDVVTVKISIKDKASLDNNSKRSRDSKGSFAPKLSYGMATGGLFAKGDHSISASADASTSTDGKGAIQRSESIELLVAAVVTEVLSNGNMVISGTQEVRVNFELRELNVAGIVRPRDISTDNSISYDKIAEARIAYGGRGRMTEVQQPGWGQQVIDLISPY